MQVVVIALLLLPFFFGAVWLAALLGIRDAVHGIFFFGVWLGVPSWLYWITMSEHAKASKSRSDKSDWIEFVAFSVVVFFVYDAIRTIPYQSDEDGWMSRLAACMLVAYPIVAIGHVIFDRVFRVYKPKTPPPVAPDVQPTEAFSGPPAAPRAWDWASPDDRAFDFDAGRFEHHYPQPQVLLALPRMIDATPVPEPQHDQWQSRPTSDAEWSDVQPQKEWQNEGQEHMSRQALPRMIDVTTVSSARDDVSSAEWGDVWQNDGQEHTSRQSVPPAPPSFTFDGSRVWK